LGVKDFRVALQATRSIPPHEYLDLHATWRVPGVNFGPLDALTVDFGIINAFDKAPPRETQFLNSGPGYSRYGDPRQRRFELGLSGHF
jgi:outer membrane receptor protein involved in Fe transport